MGKKLFDYVIGNPPYNEDFENSGDMGILQNLYITILWMQRMK